MEHSDRARLEVAAARERVDQPSVVGALERDGHRVDREVAAEEVLPDRRVLDARKRRRRVVELGAGGDDVDPLLVAVENNGGAELPMRAYAAAESVCEREGELDRIALDRDVDVEALLPQEDVANGAADEIDAVRVLADGADRFEGRCEPSQPRQLVSKALLGRGALAGDRAQRAQEVAPSDDSGDVLVAEDRDSPLTRAREHTLQLGERRVLAGGGDARAHDPLHRRVREAVADRLVEILTRDDADQPAFLGDEDAALPVPLAKDHRMRHRLFRRDRTRGSRHHLARPDRLACRLLQALERGGPSFVEREPRDRRGSLRVAAAPERLGDARGVDLRRTAADHREDAVFHLDEAGEGLAVGEVDELVSEVRDAVDVPRPRDGCHQHLHAADVVRLGRVQQRIEQITLLGRERHVEVRGDEVLIRAVAQAPRERLGVALRRARIRERAGVLVDAERERRRLERRDRELPFREDADEGRGQRPVARQDRGLRVDPVGKLDVVMVEDDLLDLRVEGDAFELAQPGRVRGLDHDQPADRAQIEPRSLDDVELLGVETGELAHVPVQGARRADDGVRVEAPRSEHRRERVEVGVAVGGDHVFGPHRVNCAGAGAFAEPGERTPATPRSGAGKAGTSAASLRSGAGEPGTSAASLRSGAGKAGTSAASLRSGAGKAGTSAASLRSGAGEPGTSALGRRLRRAYAAPRRLTFGTDLAQTRALFADRIGSGWWDGVPRRPRRVKKCSSLLRPEVSSVPALEQGYRLDLDESPRRELRDLDRRARRRAIADVARVDLVHAREVAEILQEDGRLHEPLETRAGRLEDRPEVAEDLVGLLLDRVAGQLLLAGSEADLARDEDEAVRLDRLRVRGSLKRRRRRLGPDDRLVAFAAHAHSFR